MSVRYVYCAACAASCERTEFMFVDQAQIVGAKQAHLDCVIFRHRVCRQLVVLVLREAPRAVA